MSFGAGGTNVGGVKSIESGRLKVDRDTTSFSGIGSEELCFTVPTGKAWILKAYSTSSNNFIGTVDSSYFKITTGGSSTNLQNNLTGFANLLLPNDLTLQAGDEVFISVIISNYTSGQVHGKIIYQEVTL